MCDRNRCVNCIKLEIENAILRQRIARLRRKIAKAADYAARIINGAVKTRKTEGPRTKFAITKGRWEAAYSILRKLS